MKQGLSGSQRNSVSQKGYTENTEKALRATEKEM